MCLSVLAQLSIAKTYVVFPLQEVLFNPKLYQAVSTIVTYRCWYLRTIYDLPQCFITPPSLNTRIVDCFTFTLQEL